MKKTVYAKAMKSAEENEVDEIVNELEVEEIPSPTKSESEIESKYDTGQARIEIQRNDFLVPNILEMVEKREILDISPSYQRRARWNDVKRSHLIESLLMNVPIPPISSLSATWPSTKLWTVNNDSAQLDLFLRMSSAYEA